MITAAQQARLDQLDLAAEHTRIRARMKRQRQLLTIEDALMLIALREIRLQKRLKPADKPAPVLTMKRQA